MRILLYTGKGGVGKTSLSAATALRCADLGYRTVVMSTDAAHSLGDSLDTPLGPEPVAIAGNLWAQELDLLHEMEKHWGDVQQYLSALMAWRGMDSLVAEETAVLPGMEELASLLQIVQLQRSGDYDVIVVDCAPTGATLQLLAFPEMARWYLDRIVPFQRKTIQVARPFLRAVTDMPIPSDGLFESITHLILRLEQIHTLLADPDISSARIVLNPEKMVIKEAQRALTYLNLYGYTTDLVIANRVLPAEFEGAYFAQWREAQAGYMRMVEEMFAPLPILSVPMFQQEVIGVDILRRMAEMVYGEEDPTRVYYRGRTQELEKAGAGFVMKLPLALTQKEAIQLTRSRDQLIVHIGNQKRSILLPRALTSMSVQGAQYEDNVLSITFGTQNDEMVASA